MNQHPPGPSAPRNHVIDLARIGSVLIVVIFHTLLYQVSLDAGRLVITPWAPSKVWWVISWFATIIPVFFVAAGYANTVIVDRAVADRTRYPDYLVHRVRRLLGPLTLFSTVNCLVSSVPAALGQFEQAAQLSRQFAQLLWFLAVYLLIVAVAPAAVSLHDRWGVWPMLPLVAAAVAVDAWSFTIADPGVRWLNLVFVWLVAHQWGIAYHRGWFRRWPAWVNVAVIGGAAIAIAALVFGLGYPASAVGWADIPIANVQPPTVAIAALGLAQTAALALVERGGLAGRLRPGVARVIAVANALLFTVYLWHIPAILLGGSLLYLLALAWPGAAGFLLSQGLFVVVVLVVVVVVVPLIAQVELRLIPPAPSAEVPALRALLGFAVLFAGTIAVWQRGTLVHPAATESTLAVLTLAAGIALTARAAATRPRPATTLTGT